MFIRGWIFFSLSQPAMNKLKHIILIALALFVASCGGARGAKPSQKTIAVIPKGVSHSFWQTVKAGADAAGKELNVKIVWKGPAQETDYSGQINIVEDMINQRVDGIVLAPSHGDSLVPMVERAQAAGIPVTIFDSGHLDPELPIIRLDRQPPGRGRRGQADGREARRQRQSRHPRRQERLGLDRRARGRLPRNNTERVPRDHARPDHLYGEANAAKSLAVAEDVLTSNSDLTGLFASNESSTVGAVNAIRQRNLAGKVMLVGFDATADLVQNVREGAIDSLVLQNPSRWATRASRPSVDKIGGKQPERRIDTGVELLTKENVDTPKIQELIK